MPDKTFTMTLAKVLIAAAWADGELEAEEINVLKDLIFQLPDIGGDEWQELRHYMVRPIHDDEASELIEELRVQISSEEKRLLAQRVISQLCQADGVFEAEERRMLTEVEAALSRGSGIFGGLTRFLGSLIGRRQDTQAGAEAESWLENVIYKDVVAALGGEAELEVAPAQARKLSAAAGLMAVVAEADLRVTEDEVDAITRALREHWGLSTKQAELVATISCKRVVGGLDIARIARVFYDQTDLQERRAFIKTLFAIANSAEKTSNEEIDRIRLIANFLRVPHKDYIDAKLTISREDRGGL